MALFFAVFAFLAVIFFWNALDDDRMVRDESNSYNDRRFYRARCKDHMLAMAVCIIMALVFLGKVM